MIRIIDYPDTYRQTDKEKTLAGLIAPKYEPDTRDDFAVPVYETTCRAFIELAPSLAGDCYPDLFDIKDLENTVIVNYIEAEMVNKSIRKWVCEYAEYPDDLYFDGTDEEHEVIALAHELYLAETDTRESVSNKAEYRAPEYNHYPDYNHPFAKYLFSLLERFGEKLLSWDRNNAAELFFALKTERPGWINEECWHITVLDLYEWFCLKNNLPFHHLREFYDVDVSLLEKIENRAYIYAVRYQNEGSEWYFQPWRRLLNRFDSETSDITCNGLRNCGSFDGSCTLKTVITRLVLASYGDNPVEEVKNLIDEYQIRRSKNACHEMTVLECICDELSIPLTNEEKEQEAADYKALEEMIKRTEAHFKSDDMEILQNLYIWWIKNADEKTYPAAVPLLRSYLEKHPVIVSKKCNSLFSEEESCRRKYFNGLKEILMKFTDEKTAKSAARFILVKKAEEEFDTDSSKRKNLRVMVNLGELRSEFGKRGVKHDFKMYADILKPWAKEASLPDINQAARNIADKFENILIGTPGIDCEEITYAGHQVLFDELRKEFSILTDSPGEDTADYVANLLYEKVCEINELAPCIGCE